MSIDYGVIIQARMSSSRSPGKVSHMILGKEMLHHQIMRLKENGIEDIIVATSLNKLDDKVEEIAKRCGVRLFRGSEDNVLERFYLAAKTFEVKNCIRTGGDDPLIDPNGVKTLIEFHKLHPANFIYTSHKKGWIYGTAAELIEFATLEKAYKLASSNFDREHIITFIKNNPLFSQIKVSPENRNEIRPDIFLSVDYKEDIDLITQILLHFNSEDKLYSFKQAELIDLYDSGKLDIRNKNFHDGFSD